VQEHGGEPIIPFSCILEKTLADMPEDEAAKYCKENNLQRYTLIHHIIMPLIQFDDILLTEY